MSVIYDSETDTLTILFSDTLVEESDEIKPGTILDLTPMGISFQWKYCMLLSILKCRVK